MVTIMISTGVIYGLVVVFSFIAGILILDRLDLLERYDLEVSGPLLMWRTERGKDLIERLSSKKRFWEKYGSIGIVIVSVTMLLIFLLVAWSAYVASYIPSDQAPQPVEVLALPGINPLIPIWFGILGLAIAIIVHEFAHAILARVADIKVKSLGLVFLVVPIGAFAEPDEDEMEKVDKMKRARIYAAGPTTNIVLAVIVVLIFSTMFMGSITPREEGIVISNIVENSPAARAEINQGEQILWIADERIKNNDDLSSIDIPPGEDVEVKTLRGEEERSYTEVTTGLVIAGVIEDYPADQAGLAVGDIILRVEDEPVSNYDRFHQILEEKEPGQEMNFTYYRSEDGTYEEIESDLILRDKYDSFEELYPTQNRDEYKGQAYMGVNVVYLGVYTWDVDMIPRLLSRPFAGAETPQDYVMGTLEYISLPFMGLSPLPDDIAALYTIDGPLSVIPSNTFWTISNSLYWVFWLNFLVGLFNSLPAVPLDGGFIFKDGLEGLIKRFGVKGDKSESISSGITYSLALLILFLLMWQLIGPRVL